jgi:hypothetical protein
LRIYEAVKDLVRDKNMTLLYREILTEAKADIIMCVVCELDYWSYINTMLEYMDDNMLTGESRADQPFIMRMALVVAVLCDGDSSFKLKQCIKTPGLPDNHVAFICSIIDNLEHSKSTIKSGVAFLTKIYKITSEGLNKSKNNNEFNQMHEMLLYKREIQVNELLERLMKQWYNGAIFWKGLDAANE